MYKKVLYNIKNMKKCGEGGGGAVFEPKTLSMYLKKEKENQRTNGPVNTHLISWPNKAQNIQNLENIW